MNQGQNRENETKLPIPIALRNNMARSHFHSFRESLIRIYEAQNGSLEWTPEDWKRFLNSHELYQFVCEKVGYLPQFSSREFAFCDPEGDWDEVILRGGFLVSCLRDLPEGEDHPLKVLAIRQFIKVLAQLFMKSVLKIDFTLLRINLLPGIWRINHDLYYQLVP